LAAADYRVIVPDQRGYNLSDKPKGVKAYRMDMLVADILGLIDALGTQKVNLAGHDWRNTVRALRGSGKIHTFSNEDIADV
jgi:pimeloyl-ACP methyl ester carboxylesterase